jgi:hypothetical protein
MSKFLELIESKSVLYRVRLKVDPALCVNGEIKKHESYEGFILSETEKGKRFAGLMSKYKIQNEGFFDTIGQNLKNAAVAVGKKLKDDVVSPFSDPQYNPFATGKNAVDTTESGNVINEMKKEWLDINKKVTFTVGKRNIVRSYRDLANEDRAVSAFYNGFKKLLATRVESYNNSTFLNLVSEAAPPAPPVPPAAGGAPPAAGTPPTPPPLNTPQQNLSNRVAIKNMLLRGLSLTDLNGQIQIRNMQQKYLPQIQKQLEDENNKKREMRQDTIKVSPNDVWKTLVQQVEETFKASRSNDALNQEKLLWTFILAAPNQNVKLTYNPSKQPQ